MRSCWRRCRLPLFVVTFEAVARFQSHPDSYIDQTFTTVALWVSCFLHHQTTAIPSFVISYGCSCCHFCTLRFTIVLNLLILNFTTKAIGYGASYSMSCYSNYWRGFLVRLLVNCCFDVFDFWILRLTPTYCCDYCDLPTSPYPLVNDVENLTLI